MTQCSCIGTQTDFTWPASQSEPTPLITFEKSVQMEPISPTSGCEPISLISPTGSDKLPTPSHSETSTAAPPRTYRKTDRNTTDGNDNTSKPTIRRPAFTQNPVVTQNKFSSFSDHILTVEHTRFAG